MQGLGLQGFSQASRLWDPRTLKLRARKASARSPSYLNPSYRSDHIRDSRNPTCAYPGTSKYLGPRCQGVFGGHVPVLALLLLQTAPRFVAHYPGAQLVSSSRCHVLAVTLGLFVICHYPNQLCRMCFGRVRKHTQGHFQLNAESFLNV